MVVRAPVFPEESIKVDRFARFSVLCPNGMTALHSDLSAELGPDHDLYVVPSTSESLVFYSFSLQRWSLRPSRAGCALVALSGRSRGRLARPPPDFDPATRFPTVYLSSYLVCDPLTLFLHPPSRFLAV